MSGVMATMATTPKASVTILPPTAEHAPIAKGSRKVVVMGPEATPPESNAMAVKSFGTKNEQHDARRRSPARAGTKMEMPVSTRDHRKTDRDGYADGERDASSRCRGIAPSVSSSTCRIEHVDRRLGHDDEVADQHADAE